MAAYWNHCEDVLDMVVIKKATQCAALLCLDGRFYCGAVRFIILTIIDFINSAASL